MKFDGVVFRIAENLVLFILDPKTNRIRDGVSISDHDTYKDMKRCQLSVVSVIFKDGTKEINDSNLDDLIDSSMSGTYDTFMSIKDISIYTIKHDNDDVLSKLYRNGDLNDLLVSCIEDSKNKTKNR